ncbi:zonular occludens toxin domain-containing protein [Vibrio mimicus]|uniref:zonular occludens toxin domain-containing protein n=1 Tax=Vibrio mimicus TaxID=674 RepID=UPI0011DC216D|nr:zonular occludens toxin domain-containing protein [Vibrio mimicus]TXY07550.1 hypothetical protein FXF05_01920 [Vibrio mimicus]
MLHGFSGTPGTGKTLNAIKFIIENDNFATCPVYYNGIRVLLLDFDACNSFEGWLYGVYYPANQNNTALKKKLLKIDQERRLATLDDFPYLGFEYSKHEPVSLWVTWFKRVASQHRLNLFNEALTVLGLSEEDLTGDIIKSLGLSWNRFDDPTKIHELPSGSVILADEVQNIWPTRQSSKDPTPDVQFVATHRHNAQNLIYVSQDFRDVDQFIRRRIAHYTHFEFLGGEWLNRFHSNNLFDPSSKADLVRVGSEKVRRDNKYYGLYLSSIDHTQKVGLSASMKKALKLGLFAIIMLSAGVIGLFQTPLFSSFLWGEEPEETVKTESSSTPVNTSESHPVNKQQSFNTYVSELLSNVYIDGSTAMYFPNYIHYTYSFSNAKTGQVFYPDNIGLHIKPVNHCTAIVKFEDVIQVITCNPFYTRPEYEEQYEREEPNNTEIIARN